MKKPQLSIVIPVYNAEKYLCECIDSITSQTNTDWELLLIDDGSKDASGTICDHYSSADSRITVFHKQNEGANAARKYGIERAAGEYLCFIDADDYIKPTMVEDFLHLAAKNNSDIVQSVFFLNNPEQECLTGNFPVCLSNDEALNSFFKIGRLRPSMCLGIYRRKLFDDIVVPTDIHFWEDYALKALLVSKAKTVSITNKAYYYYRMNESSTCNTMFDERRLSCLKIKDFLSKQHILRNKQDERNVSSFFIKCMLVDCVKTEEGKKYVHVVKKEVFRNIKSILLSESLNMKYKALLILSMFNMPLVRRIYTAHSKKSDHQP